MRYPLQVLTLLSLMFVLFSPSVRAEPKKKVSPEERQKAASLFDKAEAHYKVQQFSLALDEYREAYLLSLEPALLFNMAQCYRQLGQYDQALTSYRTFLRESPNTPLQADVEGMIAEVEAAIAKPTPSATVPISTPSKPEVSTLPTKVLWGGVLLGVAGIGVGGVALVQAKKSSALLVQEDFAASRKSMDNAVLLGAVSDGAVAAAILTVGAGIYLKKHRHNPKEAALVLSPAGLTYACQF